MSALDTAALEALLPIAVIAVVLALLVPYKLKGIEVREGQKKAEEAFDEFSAWHSPLTLDEIWEIPERKRFLAAMQGWFLRKLEWQGKLDGADDECTLSPAEWTALDVLNFDSLVCANGLHDFWLCHGHGGSADRYEAELREVGALAAADLWNDAVELIGGGEGDPEMASALSELDSRYRRDSDAVKSKLYEYILLHRGEFSE